MHSDRDKLIKLWYIDMAVVKLKINSCNSNHSWLCWKFFSAALPNLVYFGQANSVLRVLLFMKLLAPAKKVAEWRRTKSTGAIISGLSTEELAISLACYRCYVFKQKIKILVSWTHAIVHQFISNSLLDCFIMTASLKSLKYQYICSLYILNHSSITQNIEY